MVLRIFLYTQLLKCERNISHLGTPRHLFNEKNKSKNWRNYQGKIIWSQEKREKILQMDHFNITNPESRFALNSDDQREGNSPDSLIYSRVNKIPDRFLFVSGHCCTDTWLWGSQKKGSNEPAEWEVIGKRIQLDAPPGPRPVFSSSVTCWVPSTVLEMRTQ